MWAKVCGRFTLTPVGHPSVAVGMCSFIVCVHSATSILVMLEVWGAAGVSVHPKDAQ